MKEKGYQLEELTRAYFEQQGLFALRSVPLRFGDELITDIDVWLYDGKRTNERTRTIIDIKNRRIPKVLERILWLCGVQKILNCDNAIVVTSDRSRQADKINQFALQQDLTIIKASFLTDMRDQLSDKNRLSLEQFGENINQYKGHKQDGNWLNHISNAKASLINLSDYRAFNTIIKEFAFFARRIETKPRFKEQTIRCTYFVTALACIALDNALKDSHYEDPVTKRQIIEKGVTYGGDSTLASMNRVLDFIAKSLTNGRTVVRQIEDTLQSMFRNVRADIISEFFVKKHNAALLLKVARELERCAHSVDIKHRKLTTEAKTILGIFADFIQVERSLLLYQNPNEKIQSTHNTGEQIELKTPY